MDVDNISTMEHSLCSLKLSAVEKFMDNYKQNGDVLFASFEIYRNTYPVYENLRRDIATYARKVWTSPNL